MHNQAEENGSQENHTREGVSEEALGSRRNLKTHSFHTFESPRFRKTPEQDDLQGFCSEEDDSNASQELNGERSSSEHQVDVGRMRHICPCCSLYGQPGKKGGLHSLLSLHATIQFLHNNSYYHTCTMLEEAVQYVKFLQLQVKLRNFDDLWMYAPIAYNGTNTGLDLNITPNKQP
ncbi:hypothetical protein VNO78_27182 [Psophocarpus tetragonolobus]|uniref:Uncharacterized protein n=1 Tax=Psophocarpus tetragonolobus TaxID=3891 RepID=A0AAN9S307_PSOTE